MRLYQIIFRFNNLIKYLFICYTCPFFINLNSTLRFPSLPSSVSFVPTGLFSPRPIKSKTLSLESPNSINFELTFSALLRESLLLYEAAPLVSVYPIIDTRKSFFSKN